MALESDIYTEIWNFIRGYQSSTLSYIRGWFKSDMENIPVGKLPALCLYPTSVEGANRQGGGDRFLFSLVLRGSIQHFDVMEAPEGTTGRKGILDFYHDLDRVLFTMLRQTEVTVDSVTVTTQTFPVFTNVSAVRDIIIGNASFSTETYNEDYPNLDVVIPISIWYVKTDEVRRIT